MSHAEYIGSTFIGDGDNITSQINELLQTKETEYGNAVTNMERCADVWNWYMSYTKLPLTGKDVALLNVLFKISRELGKHKPDNLDDIIGWATIAKQCAEVEK